jgi:superfamily II DNA/RNA helicase
MGYGTPHTKDRHLLLGFCSGGRPGAEPPPGRPTISHATSTPPTGSFVSYGLDPRLLKGLEAAGYTQPRLIQHQTIPAALAGKDVLGLAQTGTGKTAAFVLPLLSRLLSRPAPVQSRARGPRAPRPVRALVLAPTRELANQIEAELNLLGRFTGLKSTAIFGGVSQTKQVRALRAGVDVVIACPGRLLDLLSQREIDLGVVESLVLDEADQMFDMGFLPSIRRILAAVPPRRQSLLFSATMPKEVRRLADELLQQPTVVELAHTAPVATIEHAIYPIPEDQKQALLLHILAQPDLVAAIVFTRTKHKAKRLSERLAKHGHRAASLQGNLSQSQRDRTMAGFRDGSVRVLVATDIAARGLDIEQVSHVINFDVPISAEAYTHRIGRTGRSGRQGRALTFVTREDRDAVRDIERGIKQTLRVAPVDLAALAAFKIEAPSAAENLREARAAARSGARGRSAVARPARGQGGRRSAGARPESAGRSQAAGRPVRSNAEGERQGQAPAAGGRSQAANRATGDVRPGREGGAWRKGTRSAPGGGRSKFTSRGPRSAKPSTRAFAQV